MVKSLRVGRVLPAMVASAMLVAAAGPATIASFYCREMRTSLAHPCCGESHAQPDGSAASINRERCCTSSRLTIERPAAERVSQPDRPLAPQAVVCVLLNEPGRVACPSTPANLALPRTGSGPPILDQTCVLLI